MTEKHAWACLVQIPNDLHDELIATNGLRDYLDKAAAESMASDGAHTPDPMTWELAEPAFPMTWEDPETGEIVDLNAGKTTYRGITKAIMP